MLDSPSHEVIESPDKRVACDGGGDALGHPKIYLTMGKRTNVTCPYCSREFILMEDATVNT